MDNEQLTRRLDSLIEKCTDSECYCEGKKIDLRKILVGIKNIGRRQPLSPEHIEFINIVEQIIG
jgi:hypothetical protein